MGFLHSGGAQRDCDKMRTTLFRHEYERRSARACRVLSPTCHVTKTDKSWRKKCRLHKNDAIALITIDVSRCCIWFLLVSSTRHRTKSARERIDARSQKWNRRFAAGMISARHHVCGSAHAMTLWLLRMISQPTNMD